MIGLAKAAEWQKPVNCMYRGCSKPSIAKSHAIQRSGPIGQLLEDGHVVTPRFLDGELKIKRQRRLNLGRAQDGHEGPVYAAVDRVISRHAFMAAFRSLRCSAVLVRLR
jgi:hypothetical protein